MRAESAVEPTRSENMTVTWRRSAVVSLDGGAIVSNAAEGASASLAERRSAIASSRTRRCPTIVTPKSFKSSAVRRGRTLSVIAFSRKAASYCSSPRLLSQLSMSKFGPLGCCPRQFLKRVKS